MKRGTMLCGVASRCITPDRPILLAGYASRDRPSEGAYQDLFVKALALDAGDGPAVIVTSDLIYLDADVLDPVEAELAASPGISAAHLLFTGSHTHCAPVVRMKDARIYGGRDERYVEEVRAALVAVARAALTDMEPARLAYRRTSCDFNVNRRLKTPDGVQMRPNPAGEIDRDVDILTAERADGTMKSVLFGYVCHPTTMGGYLVGGDYPGFAQRVIEAAYPATTALFVQGCSGDVRPNNVDEAGAFKSGPLEVVEAFGRRLGTAVLEELTRPGTPIDGDISVDERVVELPVMQPPDRNTLATAREDRSPHRRRWAEEMLAAYDAGRELPRTWAAHVQTMRIGRLTFVALAGEACVGIGNRLKRIIGDGPRFVLGYANRVVGYIPSKSIHADGGYEVDGWYFYEGMPAPFTADAEDRLVMAAREMLGR